MGLRTSQLFSMYPVPVLFGKVNNDAGHILTVIKEGRNVSKTTVAMETENLYLHDCLRKDFFNRVGYIANLGITWFSMCGLTITDQ